MTNLYEELSYTDPLLDEAIIIECSIEHPQLEGNLCVNDLDHTGGHEDATGNTWFGQDWINNR